MLKPARKRSVDHDGPKDIPICLQVSLLVEAGVDHSTLRGSESPEMIKRTRERPRKNNGVSHVDMDGAIESLIEENVGISHLRSAERFVVTSWIDSGRRHIRIHFEVILRRKPRSRRLECRCPRNSMIALDHDSFRIRTLGPDQHPLSMGIIEGH